MASKRKSSTPCMIPSKAPRLNEGDQDSPIYLGPSRISEIDRNAAADLGEEREATEAKDGTYTCSGHPDFRADSCFLCLTCGISSAKFEGLALHNARVHPSTLNTSLQLKVKDKRVMVEQTFVNTTEMGKDIEIAISKTPIMRMLKGKSEPKKIVVSHTILDEPESVPASRETDRKDSTTTTVNVSHVPTLVHNSTAKVMPSAIQIVNGSGALPMLKTPITQVVSVVQNKNVHHSTPVTASNVSSSSTSSKNLPKVMIPLSSIPTYSASMDESSFLKTSFSKFPYPTKAELCYLTVVTKFPEEQIKIWFTAQRLKQGISWSPEEIEEARRKMFNTIIQTAPATSASLNSTAQHTIVLPASLGATGLSQILQGSLVNHGGVIVTQPMMANGIQVSSAPVALAVTPKPQAAARPMMQARPTAALVADKGVSMVIGTVGSSSAGRNVISPSNRNGTSSVNSSGQASVINLSLGSSNRAKSNIVNGKHSTNIDDVHSSASNSPNIRMEDAASPASKCSSPSPAAPSISGSKTPVNPFLDPSFYKGKKSQEQLGALKDSFLVNQFPDQEEVDRLIALTGLTVREVRKWFSDRRYHLRNLKGSRTSGGQGKDKTSGSSSAPGTPANPLDLSDASGTPDPAPQSPSASQTPTSPITPSRRAPRPPSPDFTAIRYKERDPYQVKALEASFCQSPDPSNEEVDRLRAETKMTRREIHGWFTERRKRMAAEKKRQEEERAMREEEEAEGEEEEVDEEEPKVNPIKINLKMLKVTEAKQEGKKTPDQLHMLKKIYARTQWPSATQYDELISGTGLPRPEVVRWFGDCRYVQKNGQLKWLEAYQRTVLTEDLEKGNDQALQAHLDSYGRLNESEVHESLDLRFLTRQSEAQLPGSSSPMEPQPGAGNEEKMEQSVCGVSKDE
uniref:Zinc fingers and homeoboxes 3 n=1 Tax=Neogobius melanostomus TaxID=47308 RepID=A0A8C6TBU2_9GOBI